MVLKLLARRIAAVTWVLILGGMLVLALGLVLRRTDPALGWGIAGGSIAAIVIGVLLIWLRSRMHEGDAP